MDIFTHCISLSFIPELRLIREMRPREPLNQRKGQWKITGCLLCVGFLYSLSVFIIKKTFWVGIVINNWQMRQWPKSGSGTCMRFLLGSLRTVPKFCLSSFKDQPDLFAASRCPLERTMIYIINSSGDWAKLSSRYVKFLCFHIYPLPLPFRSFNCYCLPKIYVAIYVSISILSI